MPGCRGCLPSDWKATLKLHIILFIIPVSFSTVNIYGTLALEGIAPLPFIAVRLLTGALFNLILCLIFERESFMKSLGDWKHNIKNLWLGIGLPQFCSMTLYIFGLEYSNPINCGALYLATVPVTAIFSMVLKQEMVSPIKILGVLCSFSGALVMLELDKFSITNETVIGDLLILIMVAFYSFYLLFTKKFSQGLSAYTSSFWMFYSGGIYGAITVPFHFLFKAPLTYPGSYNSETGSYNSEMWVSVVIVCVVGTLLPFTCANWALQKSSSLLVAVYTPLELVSTVVLGIIVLQYEPTWIQGLGASLIVAGVFLVLFGKYRERVKHIEDPEEEEVEIVDDEEQPLNPVKK